MPCNLDKVLHVITDYQKIYLTSSVVDPDSELDCRILMFFTLPDPDPLVRGMDLDIAPFLFS
jgi:hypothetical protein